MTRFSLQNGGDMIGRYFTSVYRIEYPDSLSIDKAAPIAEYVCSMAGMGIGFEPVIRKRERFQAFLDALIREKGAVHISKSVGIFIARA